MSLPFLKSPLGDEPVVVEGHFNVSPERVFRAWTDSQEVKAWFGPGGEGAHVVTVDPRVGGRWRLDYGLNKGQRDVLEGKYLEVVANSRLVFSWIHERRFDDGRVETTAPSQVTVTFAATPDGTFLRLVHERIVKKAGRLGVGEGWNGTFASLENYLAENVSSMA